MNETVEAHIVSAFDEDLKRIEGLLLEMGGRVEQQIAEAVGALDARDAERAEAVRASDKAVDALEAEVDEQAVRLLALRQPMAADLRKVVSTLKVSAYLERVGDYAKNVAKRTSVLVQEPEVGSATKTIRRMGKLTQDMLHDVLEAYVNRDLVTADDVIRRDEEVDQLHNALFRELLTYMMEDPRRITSSMHLLFVAKNVERIGDHITGVAEQVHFLTTGTMPGEDRPKADRTSMMGLSDVRDAAE